MALPWKIPIPVIEGQGNFGGRGNDPPASPYYTEARMSPAGQIALASERSQIAPVPLGLINGNTHRQGTRPPFRPAAVIDTIWQVLARPRLPARQITTLMGLPDFITGCAVTGDLAALAAGQRTELGLHARVTVTDAAYVRARVAKAAVPGYTPPRYTQDASRPVIIVDKLPPYANPDDTVASIADRARGHPWHARHPELGVLTSLPITDIQDLTARGDHWFACLPANGTPPEVLRDQLMKVHGVTIYVSVGLPRPLPTMIRTWTRTYQHEDLPASLTALENALASRRQKRLAYD